MFERPLVLLELNELTPALMTRFIAEGRLPNFGRLHDEAQVFLTDAGEEPPNLEPWIQWVTVHCGLPFSAHGIFDLGDGHRLRHPSLWDIVSSAGGRVWVCGSMNPGRSGVNGLLLPDPWSHAVPPSDARLEPYCRFVRGHVLEYTRPDRVPLAPRDYARFALFMARNGLRARTCAAVLRQLLGERSGTDTRWRRASILDRLQFDLFRKHYRRLRPDFATFFANSTAHYQHVYWRSMEPWRFAVAPREAEQRATRDAIRFGYEQMDRLLGEMYRLVGEDAILAFATGLSQQPCLKYEADGGKTFYRLTSLRRLFELARVDARECRLEPVMSEEFHLRFAEDAEARAAARALAQLTVDGQRALRVRRAGASVFAGCAIHHAIAGTQELHGPGGRMPFSAVFYRVNLTKSGMHHPLGMFWVCIPGVAGTQHEQPVPLVDVAPTLLDLLGVPIPQHMTGRPLLRRAVTEEASGPTPPHAARLGHRRTRRAAHVRSRASPSREDVR